MARRPTCTSLHGRGGGQGWGTLDGAEGRVLGGAGDRGSPKAPRESGGLLRRGHRGSPARLWGSPGVVPSTAWEGAGGIPGHGGPQHSPGGMRGPPHSPGGMRGPQHSPGGMLSLWHDGCAPRCEATSPPWAGGAPHTAGRSGASHPVSVLPPSLDTEIASAEAVSFPSGTPGPGERPYPPTHPPFEKVREPRARPRSDPIGAVY